MLSLICRAHKAPTGFKCIRYKFCPRFCTNRMLTQDASKKQLESLREVRAARKSKVTQVVTPDPSPKPAASSKTFVNTVAGIAVVTLILGGLIYEVKSNPNGDLSKYYEVSGLKKFLEVGISRHGGGVDDDDEEEKEKLLPDYPTAPCYAGIPPGVPCPPLLVLDLENTLVASTYDARYGWRHVKRPGLDKFISVLSKDYEIVLFSENDLGMVDQILVAIDPNNVCHKLGMNSGEIVGTTTPPTVIKRLDYMNRDLAKVILIDDDPVAYQKFPRNTLAVKPFKDGNDISDTVLLDLIPLLQAMHQENVEDFRDCLDNLGTHDAQDASVEYRLRISQKKRNEKMRRHQGLGGLIRGAIVEEDNGGDLVGVHRSSILSASDIVGQDVRPAGSSSSSSSSSVLEDQKKAAVPEELLSFRKGKKKASTVMGDSSTTAQKKKGSMFEWLEKVEKEKEEQETRKMEKMQELYLKKQAERAKQQN